MTALIDAAIARSRTTLLILLLILVTGATAYLTIPKEANPDVNIPLIYVSMHHEGISPEDAERLLVRPMEVELRSIEGVKEMRATAYEGGANVILEFTAGFDADEALNDVREKVDLAKPELPDDTDEPTVSEVNFSLFPVIVVSLSGQIPERTLLRLARDLEDEIEGIASVLDAKLVGDREERVEVIIDPLRLESYGIDAVEALNSIARNNLLIAAGALDSGEGRFAIKVPGLFESVQDIQTMPLKVNDDRVVTIGDIGEVRRTFVDRESYARVNGAPAISIEISKRTGENVIETIEAVREVVAREQAHWPPGVSVTYSRDESVGIRDMLADLQNNVISAVLLVTIVVVALLGLRSAALVCVAIPGSFLLGILVISSLGLTVNIVVLFSLILAVGMLVDGAIVVTEYADRKLSEGAESKLAYGLAAKRMAWPITASTATTLAAFLPLVFWPGVVGEFMKYLPITLLATLSASLAMALIFVPTLGTVIGGRKPAINENARILAADGGNVEQLSGFTGAYVKVLDQALNHPTKLVLAGFAMLIGVQVYYATHGNGVEFFPDVEPENAVIEVHARGNLSVDEKAALVREVEAIAAKQDAFRSIYTSVGALDQGSDYAEDTIGLVHLEFRHWESRPPAAQVLKSILDEAAGLAGIKVAKREEEAGPPVGKPIQLEISARNPALLEPVIATLLTMAEDIDGLEALEDSRPLPGIEWKIAVDRAQAAKFGADVSLIGKYVQLVTNGLKVTDYRPDDSRDEIDVVVRYPEGSRVLDMFEAIRIQTDSGLVPLSNFVTRTPEPQIGTLDRVDGRRVMTIQSDVAEGILPDDKVTEIRERIAELELPDGVSITFKGEDEEQKAAMAFLGKAFMVALFIMAIILVTQFNSFYSAALILSAVLMSTVGVMLGLLIMGEPFGIVMSGIGVIALAGIVVNNNIVLIDTFDRLKHEVGSAREAILKTGAQRLRPVLLTTVTTILGLMPMVLQVNIDFVTRHVSLGAPSTQWWVQLSTAIVFGLSFATILTLFITPSALMIRANLQSWRRERRQRREAKKAAQDGAGSALTV